MHREPEWFSEIRGFVIDMDGVLYRGSALIPEVPRFLDSLALAGITYMMATNNATATPADYERKLARMGVDVPAAHILTSALATAAHLRATYPSGSKAYVVGMQALRDAVFGDGHFVEDWQDADVVVSGADFELRYDDLKYACLGIRGGADYVVTNADTTFPSEEGIIPGSGAIVAALVAATNAEPTVVGKPSQVMVDNCLEMMGLQPEQAAMLGDRLDTDILAGQRAGMKTIMVLTGISSELDIEETGITPDLVLPDLDPLSDWISAR